MDDTSPLLTIVLLEAGTLDRESLLYRRLISARLRRESEFEILHVSSALTTSAIMRLCEEIGSKYVVFMQTSHQISATYVPVMLDYLRKQTVYLAEPVFYAGSIPNNVAATKIEPKYYYARDSDVFGTVFNTRRLADALQAIGDVDRSALYVSYRLYWSLASVTPLPVGFSVASDTKSAIGLRVESDITRLVPLIPSTSKELRLYLLRLVTLFLRGTRAQKKTGVSLSHLRDLVQAFELVELVELVDPLQPFEGSWLRWLAHPMEEGYFYKQLSDGDTYLSFREGEPSVPGGIRLYRLCFGEDLLTIYRSYLPRSERAGHDEPANYDFYSRPITPASTLLFFDRPMQADDNAEHLYEYFTSHHPEYAEVYFALNPKSPDWERLERKGFNLVPIFTTEFYEMFLISDLVVSSQIYNIRYRGKSFANSRFVYLQHGVQLNDMTDWITSKYFDVFIATGKIEADYLRKLAPVETLNSGLPRLESLSRAEKQTQHLLFMPTWRFNLHQSSAEHFARSDYFMTIDRLISDQALLEFLERTNRILHVKLHPNVEKRATQFRFSKRVLQSELSYRDAIESAEMVFTDYSSAVIDAAFIGIPIAYYHWDSVEFFRDQPYEGRLDYREDGLGPVFQNHAEIVRYIVQEEYLRHDERYERRRARFFEGVDPNRINATIVERMLGL